MAKDKVFEKQLEKWGTEATVLKTTDSNPRKDFNRDAQIAVVRSLMETIQGRQWLWEKLDMCQVFGSTFIAGKPDVRDYLSGVRDVGLHLFSEINQVAPELIQLMNQEAAQRKLIGKKLKDEPNSSSSSDATA